MKIQKILNLKKSADVSQITELLTSSLITHLYANTCTVIKKNGNSLFPWTFISFYTM